LEEGKREVQKWHKREGRQAEKERRGDRDGSHWDQYT
jgi:hypothetical protein